MTLARFGMGSTAKKDRKNADILDGKTSPPFVAESICFVIYARMRDLFGCHERHDIERFVLLPWPAYICSILNLTFGKLCCIFIVVLAHNASLQQ